MSEPLRFSVKLKQVPVEIEEIDGTVRTYTLREMDGTERDRYLNAVNKRAKVDRTGTNTSVRDFNGLSADLLTLCLLDPDGHPVTVNTIQSWPASVSTELYKAAAELSGLNKGADDEAKKHSLANASTGSDSQQD